MSAFFQRLTADSTKLNNLQNNNKTDVDVNNFDILYTVTGKTLTEYVSFIVAKANILRIMTFKLHLST